MTPTQALIAPTISKNGVNLGSLINPWLTGYHRAVLYALPPGTSISPSDTVTLTAPAGWANTSVGITAELNNQAIDNRAGRSAVGTDKLKKTFKPGWNNAHLGTPDWGTYQVPKNWSFRCNAFNNIASATPDGKPLTLTASQAASQFYSQSTSSGIDKTIAPMPPGLWAVGWDDLDPTHPTTCDLTARWTPGLATVTERVDLANPGVGGIGQVRVFDVQPLTTIAGTAPNDHLSMHLQIYNDSLAPRFANLVIYGPGDFSYKDNTPTVLDRSDPFAVSNTYLDRLKNGAGSLRWVDASWDFAGISNMCEPEHIWNLTDFSWGLWGGKSQNVVYPTVARPWDQIATPYVYSTLFGTPYGATLAAPITDTTTTVLTISDAATAPVIVGLRLKVDSELMRVLAVSGTQVTVERGSCSTTPAPHAAGAIQVQNRWAVAGQIPNGDFFELVCPAPHKFNTAQVINASGSWPGFTFTDGHQPLPGGIGGFAINLFVTGANTLVGWMSATSPTPVTLNQTYTLDASCNLHINYPETPGLPVGFTAKATAKIAGCNIHINVPHAASDSLVDAVAVAVRDNLPAGRTVYVEYANEPWNFYFEPYNLFGVLSSWLYPGQTPYAWYIARAGQIWQRFRDRFNDHGANRGSEIKGIINCQRGDAGNVANYLNFGRTNGTPIDGIAIAGYLWPDNGPLTSTAFWQYDDEQAIDLFIHDLYYNVSGNGIISAFQAMNAAIAAYNAANNANVFLYGYEGGVGYAVSQISTTLSSAVDNVTQAIPVTSAAGLVVGTPVLVESEWMSITGINGNTLQVNRGQNGSTAAAHNNSVALRPAWIERSRDLVYNPNWYIAEQDYFGMIQLMNFRQFNQYTLSIGTAETGTYYGAYHWQAQPYGKGDGSDGLADNRLTLACPGKPNTKPATVNQDMSCVSVRGQAFIDWMTATQPGKKPRAVFQSYRTRP